MPTSRLVNRQLKESGFRSKYHINIVGVRRKGQYIMDNLAQLRLHAGDVLLVQGTWENIARLNRDEDDWVVLVQPLEEAEKVTLDYKAPLAACIMLLMIALMVFDFIPVAPVTAVMFAGVFHCLVVVGTDGVESLSLPLCRNPGSQHVFCHPVFHPAQCFGDAGRQIHIHGLCQGRFAPAAHHRHSHGLCPPPSLRV